MSYQYASFPKVKLSFPTTNLSYCYINYKGNTTATSNVVYSGKITDGTYSSADLSFNVLYTFTLTPLDSKDVSGVVKYITVDTTPKNSGTKSSNGKSTYEATTLQWSGTTYDYYKVTRSLEGTTAYTDISTNVAANTYYDNDLSGNSIYYYYVTPYKTGGTAYTAATPIYIYTNVRAPTDMSSTVYDSSSITMTWKTKNSYDTSYYNTVYVKNNTTGAIVSASGDIQSYTMKDLSKNTTYTCYAQTYLLSAGTAITATTASPYVGGNVVLYSVSMNSVTVSWSGQYYDRVAVYRRVGTTASYTTLSGDDYASPYVDGDISGNTTYYYYVVPKISVFTGSASSVVSSTTPVAYPTDVSATFYDTSAIKLAFTSPKNSYSTTTAPAYYARAIYGGNTYTSSSASTSPILLQNLSSGTTYSCYILTYLDGAYGSTSSALSVTTSSSNTRTTTALNIKAWYNPSSITTSGTTVTSWANYCSSASGLSASLSPSGTVTTTTYNSLPYVYTQTNASYIMSSTSTTIGGMIVCFINTSINADNLPYVFWFGSNTGPQGNGDFSSRRTYSYDGSLFNTNDVEYGSGGQVYLDGKSVYDYTNSIAVSYTNALNTQHIYYSKMATTYNSTSYKISLGSSFMSRSFIGYIGDVFVFNTSHTSDNRQFVEAYLSNKYGVTIDTTNSYYGKTCNITVG